MTEKLQNDLEKVYSRFFLKMNIDFNTGIILNSNKRFATKAGIGNNYEKAPKKILFISLDIGRDELFVDKGINSFQNYENRTSSVCNNYKDRNAHMAGVFGISLYLLKDTNGWKQEWKLFESSSKFFKYTLFDNYEILPTDVLHNIAQINFFNFVEVGRLKRSGNMDRKFIDKETEIQLNIDLINELKPDEIVVHGTKIHNLFRNKVIPQIKHNCNIYLVMHPSVLGKNINLQVPINYVNKMNENVICNYS